VVLGLAAATLGCGRGERRSQPPSELPVNVLADTGRSERLRIQAPPAKATVWLAQVSPSRPPALDPALPVPSPAAPENLAPEPPRLQVDEGLKPPLVRRAAALRVPSRSGAVELDVRVTEEGDVSDALWAGGSRDSALVAAAISCALEMRFYPALQGGRPVAVWCRQRFDFSGR